MAIVHYYPRSSPVFRTTGEWRPAIDIIEQADEYVLYLDLPGLQKDAFHLKVDEGVLVISGDRKTVEPSGVRSEDYYEYYERPAGKFSRSFRLPDHVDPQSIGATYQNGILEVHLKKSEQAKSRTITIE